ncbi:hypothetical protein PanWU01x14_253820 [Parasponia andersonii]|uniref:Flavin-containing monooxygenase n=1 Tax=Parasponia andersonii TaxID=3476 RepID=A0A2P5BBJ6_PARAD|nr:hypothetical protein PanWU01x14_253820 [Parasponia andersonii]
METPIEKVWYSTQNSFLQDISSCQVAMLPENFYEKIKQGSIVLKKSQNLSFCRESLIMDGEFQPLETYIMILATGYRSDQTLKNMFSSSIFQTILLDHIPQWSLSIEGFSNLVTSEIRYQWLVYFLGGTFELLSISAMEKDPYGPADYAVLGPYN